MEIPKEPIKLNTFAHTSIDRLTIEDLDLDLSNKPNVFSNNKGSQPKAPQKPQTNSIKRLNAMDTEFFKNEEITDSSKPAFSSAATTVGLGQIFSSVKRVAKNIGIKIPVLGYFLTKEKRAKIKATLTALNSLNSQVNELMKTSTPYGEQSEVYSTITKNLLKANNIHSKIIKDIEN